MKSLAAINELKVHSMARHFSIKQMEKTRKGLWRRNWKNCGPTERKDDVITFEQLGVDRLFVDESARITRTVRNVVHKPLLTARTKSTM